MATLTNDEYTTPIRMFGSQLTIRDLVHIAPNPSTLNRIRNELHEFAVQTFGSPIAENNLAEIYATISQILSDSVLGRNGQSEHSSYNVLLSVNNLIRHTLPTVVTLILEDDSIDFGMRLLRAIIEFVRRLLVILVLCVGRLTTSVFINEMTNIGIQSSNGKYEKKKFKLI